MKAIVDTREQLPLNFSHFEYITEIHNEKLEVGDYVFEYTDGFRPPIHFERKSLTDLYGTLGKGYSRFKREILKSQDLDIKLIIIVECSMKKVIKGHKHTTMDGNALIRKLFTIWVKHGIYTVYCDNREEVERYVYEFYYSIGKLKGKRSKLPATAINI